VIVPQIKVKIQRRPNIKLKMLPRFPSSVTGEGGIEVDNEGGHYVIRPELGVLGDVVGPGSSASVAGQIAVFTDGNHIEGSGLAYDDLAFEYSTLAEAAAANIPAHVDVVRTLGHTTPNDYGGASYIRIPDATAAAWRFQSADGQWWALNSRSVTPEMLGAKGDGVTNDSAVFVAMSTYINANTEGVVINHAPGATYLVWPAGTIPMHLLNLSNVNGLVWNWNGSRMTTDNDFASGGFGVSIWAHCSNVTINDLNFEWSTSGGAPSTIIGPLLFVVQETSAPWSENFVINNSIVDGALYFLRVTGDVASAQTSVGGEAKNFTVLNADIQNCHFPLNFQASGDNFFGRGIKIAQAGRAYFPYNVHNHDVDIISTGTTANSILIKSYPFPNMSERRRTTSNIRARYTLRPPFTGIAGGNICHMQFEQNVAAVTVSNAVSSGGKVRLTVNSTADMLTGQTWHFNAITGTTEANGTHEITVVNATTVDLLDVNFVNAYISGGTGSVPGSIRDIDIFLDIPSDDATGFQMFGTSKFNSSGVVDPVVCGYDVSNVTISGRHKGYNRVDVPSINLFPTTSGQWNNEQIHNFNLKDILITGTQGSCAVVVPTGATINLENITSSGVTWTLPTTAAGLRVRNFDTPGLKIGTSSGWVSQQPTVTNSVQSVDPGGNSALVVGQGVANGSALFWRYNATASNATAELVTFGYLNPLSIDAQTVTINDNSNGATNIHNSGAAPTGTGAYVRATSPTLVAPALGTPASGVVTNLTGTASININGTVGATTPTTGAFTTATASTSVTSPISYGGSAAGSTLTINGTSNGAPSSAFLLLQTNSQRTGLAGCTSPQAGVHIGPGTDAPNLGSVNFYISNSGTTSFAVRDSTNDIELGMFTNTSGGGLVAMGTRTSHPFWIQTNAANTAAFHVSGGFSVGGTTDPGTNAIAAVGPITANSGTAIPAGGTAGSGLKVSSTANFGIFFGSGAPTLSAAKGSLYLRSDGSGTSDRMYVNTNGSTTWTAVTTVA
jgi:hypothetical protein